MPTHSTTLVSKFVTVTITKDYMIAFLWNKWKSLRKILLLTGGVKVFLFSYFFRMFFFFPSWHPREIPQTSYIPFTYIYIYIFLSFSDPNRSVTSGRSPSRDSTSWPTWNWATTGWAVWNEGRLPAWNPSARSCWTETTFRSSKIPSSSLWHTWSSWTCPVTALASWPETLFRLATVKHFLFTCNVT